MSEKEAFKQVQRADPDRYRAAILGDKKIRDALLSLYNFHYELSRIPALVTEPMLGEIRYQWWRDRVRDIADGNPVSGPENLTSIQILIEYFNLAPDDFVRLINGRARDLDPAPFDNLHQAAEYTRETSGVLLTLAAQIIALIQSVDISPEDTETAGQAWGLTGLLRSWPHYQNTMLSRLEFSEVFDLAQTSYLEAQRRLKAQKPDLLAATAYVTLVPGYLKRVKELKLSTNTDSLGEGKVVNYPVILKQMRILSAVVKGRL